MNNTDRIVPCRDASEYFLIHSHRRRFIFIGACIACRRRRTRIYHIYYTVVHVSGNPYINHFCPRADCNSRHPDDETLYDAFSLSFSRACRASAFPISMKKIFAFSNIKKILFRTYISGNTLESLFYISNNNSSPKWNFVILPLRRLLSLRDCKPVIEHHPFVASSVSCIISFLQLPSNLKRHESFLGWKSSESSI